MNTITDVMLDLETLDTRVTAAVVSMAAVPFNLKTGFISDDVFYSAINLDSALRYGTASGDTLRFWVEKAPPEALAAAWRGTKAFTKVLDEFTQFMTPFSQTAIWSQGPAFDVAILERLYSKMNLPTPWKFWNARDVRTIIHVCNAAGFPTVNKPPVAHNALEDARQQTRNVIQAYRNILSGR